VPGNTYGQEWLEEMNTLAKLAINGGVPLEKISWPVWPPSNNSLEKDVVAVLRSGRWTMSGAYRGQPSREAVFSESFAEQAGVRFGVTTCNGTHALITALEALDIGPGDEVIVPGMTWVADATAVINVNATPIIVDIDETLGISPTALEAAITPRTKAIIAVHLYCTMPRWDDILSISSRRGVPVIEDAAQAHGAEWKHQRAGSLGIIAAFSFQQSKLLTSGEGGIALTNDEDLHKRMRRIRCDGRDYIPRPVMNELEIDETQPTPVMGTNYCMSDITAAMLLSQLRTLDENIDYRIANIDYLSPLLNEIPGVRPVKASPEVTRRPTYQYAIRIDRQAFAGAELEEIINAFKAEIGLSAERADPPLNRSPLYRPHTKRRFLVSGKSATEIDPSRFDLPHARQEYEQLILIHHPAFLASRDHMNAIAGALWKLHDAAEEIPRAR
jgi:L-glutamine:2-deoxy-scyllo-inosose/3-amino-2,3-dideoxy-scyllo-inosose aminotransferase